MALSPFPMTRRHFVRQLGLGAAGIGAMCGMPSVAMASARRRRVVAMSDIHVGLRSDGKDGQGWLARGYDDIEKHLPVVDYGLVLGDIVHHGDKASLASYLSLRDRGPVSRWFELAGNHEHRGGIGPYEDLIRPIAPYHFIDGNVAWFFLSDEKRGVGGNLTPASFQWLKARIEANADKIIIVCSHQMLPNTVRRSDEYRFCLQPSADIQDLLSTLPITLWLCGHEHHRPYSTENFATDPSGTVCINVASMSHAYRTRTSGSLVLEIEEGARRILARRRDHDEQRFLPEFDLSIPLKTPVRLGA